MDTHTLSGSELAPNMDTSMEQGVASQQLQNSDLKADSIMPPPTRQCSFPFIPKELQNQVVRGEYVHLEDFIPDPFTGLRSSGLLLQHDDSGMSGSGSLKLVKPRRQLSNFHQWLTAWSQYERILVNFNGSLYNDLAAYREVIHAAAHKFQWSAVYMYDQCFRAVLANDHSFKYGSIHHDLYVSLLNHDAVNTKVPRCHRCQAYDHKVAHCPFPSEPAMAQAEKSSKRKSILRPHKSIPRPHHPSVRFKRAAFYNRTEVSNNTRTELLATEPSCSQAKPGGFPARFSEPPRQVICA